MPSTARREVPPWVAELEGEAAIAGDPYRQTYDAIPAAGARGAGLRRVRAVARWLVVLASLYVGGLAVMSILAHRADGPPRPADVARPIADKPRPIVRGPEVIGTAPARDKAGVHVGDALDFAVSAQGADLRYGWTLDGRPAGTGPRWTYVPMAEDVGSRRVEVILRDLGQISSERAAQALRRYFADLEDFDVEVDLLGLRSEGGRTIVRFVRRDRFRDPSGRMVLEESPPIEKEVVQTPEGLRFAPGRG